MGNSKLTQYKDAIYYFDTWELEDKKSNYSEENYKIEIEKINEELTFRNRLKKDFYENWR